jgi:phospholipase C
MFRPAVVLAALVMPHLASAATPLPFKHIIIVIQENRTPDNLFGSNPTFEKGVDIATSGKTSTGTIVPLGPEALAGCYDILHSHHGFEYAFTKGFDIEPISLSAGCTAPANPQFKYVDNSSGAVQPYFIIAERNGYANRMFQTNQGPSFPAHQFLFSGTSAPSADTPLFVAEDSYIKDGTGCLSNSQAVIALIDAKGSETSNKPIYPCFEHRTLADVLDEAPTPITWRYYASAGNVAIWNAPNAINHICVPETVNGALACTGADWVKNDVPNNSAQVLTDISNCDLQQVSWVNPTAAASDHANVSNGTGPSWVASIVNAVGKQTCGSESYWKDTAIFITWDDWGGWYDHVAPFTTPKPGAWGAGYTYGYRVPLLVVSAYTSPGEVSNAIFDFGSILAFIEHNFSLGFIGPGTDVYTNYADWQATQSGRGNLSVFFTRTIPKAFATIPAPHDAQYFIDLPKSSVAPDDDQDEP